MKKEINTLLASEEGTLRINSICYLHKWTLTWEHNEDMLEVIFDSPTGCVSFYKKTIEARKPQEIMAAVAEATEEFAKKWTEKTVSDIKAGYIKGNMSLKERRNGSGLKQREVAEMTGIDIKTVQDFESGRKDIHRAAAATVKKMAEAYGCSMEDIITE